MVKTKLEIIEETVAYYSEDTSRRGLTEYNDCMYKVEKKRSSKNVCSR